MSWSSGLFERVLVLLHRRTERTCFPHLPSFLIALVDSRVVQETGLSFTSQLKFFLLGFSLLEPNVRLGSSWAGKLRIQSGPTLLIANLDQGIPPSLYLVCLGRQIIMGKGLHY